MVNLCYLVKYQPFEDRKILKLEIMNEVTNFILLYHLLTFTDFVGDVEARYSIGWSFLFFMCGNLCVHLYLMIKGMYISLR